MAAIVLLCASVGAYMLPSIFAATSTPSISSLAATPTNTSAYAIKLTWAGYTPGKWLGTVYSGSTQIDRWTTTPTTKTKTYANGLTCGKAYTFKVAPANAGGTALTNPKSVTAAPSCATATVDSVTASGNNVTAKWHATFAQSYTLYTKVGSAGYTASGVGAATSKTVTGVCHTTYSFYVTATSAGQVSKASAAKSATTAACPVAPPKTTPTPTPTPTPAPVTTPPKSSSSSSSSSTHTSTSSSGYSSSHSSSSAAPAAPVKPSTPANFAATVSSDKIVQLTWDASTNTDHYLLNRSTDNNTWDQIADIDGTQAAYTDDAADFSTTYYYRLQAVASDDQTSDTVSAQVTTGDFTKTTGNKIASQDKAVSVVIPDGAIDGDYHCSVDADTETASSSNNQTLVLGPYELSCVDASGTVVTDFKKPVAVTLDVSTVSGFSSLDAQQSGDNGWQDAKSKYDASKQQVTFQLTSAHSFAAFGTKKSSPVGAIVFVVFGLLVVVAAVVALRRFGGRGGTAATRAPEYAVQHAAAVQAQVTAEQEFRQALAQPDCSHLSMAQQVYPSGQGCYECEQQGTHWQALRICLVCGHVGCSDDSPEQHSLKHFQETGHPLIYEYGNPAGNTIGWCYIDQTYI